MPTKRKPASNREVIELNKGDKRYVRRSADGTFGKTIDRTSLSADKRRAAKKKLPNGQGDAAAGRCARSGKPRPPNGKQSVYDFGKSPKRIQSRRRIEPAFIHLCRASRSHPCQRREVDIRNQI
jgi:hypothetical protein